MKVLGIILARGGSKTIPKKNIVPLNGIPLIVYSIKAALNSTMIDKLVVSTDDVDIGQISHKAGSGVILRPKYLCGNKVWSRDALRWTVLEAERLFMDKWEIIVELPATNPLKTPEDVKNTIKLMIDNYDKNIDSVVTVTRIIDHHPARMKRIVPGKDNLNVLVNYNDIIAEKQDSRKQDLEPAYIRNGAVYVMKRKTIIDKKDRFGDVIIPYKMPKERSINIDTKLDLEFAEFLIKKKNHIDVKINKIVEKYEKRPIPLKNNIRILCCAPFYFMDDMKKELEKIGGVYYMYNVPYENLMKLRNRFQYLITDPGSSFKYDKDFIKHFSKLKMIISPSTGLNHIDVDYAKKRKIEVIGLSTDKDYLLNLAFHSPHVRKQKNRFITASSEYTFGLIISLVRNIPKATNFAKSGLWRKYENELRGHELFSKTLGIIGLGRIGKNLLTYARTFEMDVMYYDPYEDIYNATKTSLEILVQSSDVICCCTALTKETYHLIDLKIFELMKHKKPYFINTSRGEIVDSVALIKALKENWIKMAAIDVVEDEQNLEKNILIEFSKQNPNKLIVTPHIAGLTFESQRKAARFVIDKIKNDLNGRNQSKMLEASS